MTAPVLAEPTLDPAQLAIVRWLASQWPATAATYRRALELVPLLVNGSRDLGSVPWQELDHAALCHVRERLYTRYKAATVNRTLRAVRSLARELARSGVISRERMADLLDVRDIRQAWLPQRTGKMLETDEQRALFQACDRVTYAPCFHRALVALLLAGGLRKSEAAGFLMGDFTDYDTSTGALLVRHGKGRKERVVYFTGTAKAALDEFVAGDDRGWRFRKLETSQIGFALLKLRRLAKISACTPHDMRRTFASSQFDRGTDIATIQALMGHASPAQTAAYDRRGQDRLKAAAYDPWS